MNIALLWIFVAIMWMSSELIELHRERHNSFPVWPVASCVIGIVGWIAMLIKLFRG